MDAVKFLEERKRKFNNGESVPALGADIDCNYEDAVKEIEGWSAANPRKTRQSVFLEQWPEAKIDNGGCLAVCPYYVSATHRDKYGCCVVRGKSCCDCRREFWMKVVG